MSDAVITSLNDQVARLQRENGELKAEAKRHRIGKRKAEGERDQARNELQTVTAERDQLKAAPGDKDATIADLQGQLAARDRRDQFRDAIGGTLADKVTADEVMAKAGYKPDGRALTAEQIAELVGKAKEAAPYLFKPEGQEPSDAPGGAPNAGGPLKGGPGGSQGPPDKSSARVTYTRDEVAAPGWQQKRPDLVEALVKGTAVEVTKK